MIAIDARWSELGLIDVFGLRRERWTDAFVSDTHGAHGTERPAAGHMKDESLPMNWREGGDIRR
eukprot:scaffold30636_cov100-Cyclotella_meneghiniana.AAC.1